MNELRIVLGIASGGTPTAPFIESLAKLRLPANVAPLERSVARGNFVPAQRELIMSDAIERNADYLFFVDDDIVLPSDALERLVQTAEADPQAAIVGALYYSRDSVRPITVANWTSTNTSTAHIPAFTSFTTGVVDGVGFGCALLRVAAARTLAAPYFPVHIFIERSARTVRLCDEDYLYCERVRGAGFTVRLDARVRCAHYDRGTASYAPVVWEPDAETDHDRMIVLEAGRVQLVPLDTSVPSAIEVHTAATVTYITVD